MSALNTTLPRSSDSVRVARRLVQTHATMLGSQQRDDAVLMVSELVTNALQHGVGTISLQIDVASDGCESRCRTRATSARPQPDTGRSRRLGPSNRGSARR